MSCIAVFDIGNTSLKCGIARDGKCDSVTVHDFKNLSTRKMIQAFRALSKVCKIDGAIACSVSPENGSRVRESWRAVSRKPLLFLNHRMRMPIELKYPQPATIGADRLAAASASYVRIGGAHIVMDVGTAATIDCVDAKGRFIGGAIAPGPAVMRNYLSAHTGLLPQINYAGAVPKVGRSTEGAMRIGVRVGYRAMLNSIVNHVRSGAFGDKDVHLIATGGFSREALKGVEGKWKTVANLTLEGLGLIYELNI